MLLVAAALLMGANNVKADDNTGVTLPYSNSTGSDWLDISFDSFKNVPRSAILHITYIVTEQPDQYNNINYGIIIYGKNNAKIEKDCDYTQTTCDIALSEFASIINTENKYNRSIALQPRGGRGLVITGVELITSGGGTSTNAISFSPNVVNFVFGGTYEAPTVTKTPADANVTYSSSDTNVAAIDGNGIVVPVGAGSATITGTLANTTVSATYTLNVTAPTRTGAAWTGAAWLGNYTQSGVGTQPQIPTTDLKSAQVGDNIRFYGKLGPLSATDWRCEVHGNPWSNQLGDPSGNDAFANGYFDLPITTENIGMLNTNYLILNGYNLTITAVELIPASAPAKQDVTLTFSPSTATATMGEAFNAPTLTATANGETVTGLSISYSSSNTSVATVASNGAITLLSPGRTIISASFSGNSNYNSATASYTLNVVAAVPDGELVTVEMYNYNLRTYVTPFVIDFSRSEGVEGYYAKELSGNNVVFYQITGKCAAGVPLLLRMTGTNAKVWKMTDTNATGVTPSPNLLHAGPYNANGNNIYVLTYHEGQGLNGDGYVFAETEFVGANVDSSHAYLDLTGVNTARGFKSIKFIKGDTSGISDIETESIGSKAIYNLRGQRVERPTKGLYIINGKKVLIK
jgi:hypothetical protein